MEGLVCTVDTSEVAVEVGCSTVELSCSTAADLRECTSGYGEPVPT